MVHSKIPREMMMPIPPDIETRPDMTPPQWIDPVPQGSVILETGINQANLIYDKLWKIMKESLFFPYKSELQWFSNLK